jgi:hypothetical protein
MPLRWPLLALLVSIVAWVLPLIIGDAGRRGGYAGTPLWVAITYAVAGVSLLVFIALLFAAWALRQRG